MIYWACGIVQCGKIWPFTFGPDWNQSYQSPPWKIPGGMEWVSIRQLKIFIRQSKVAECSQRVHVLTHCIRCFGHTSIQNCWGMGDSGWNVLLSLTWKKNFKYWILFDSSEVEGTSDFDHITILFGRFTQGLGWLPTRPTWENLTLNLGPSPPPFTTFFFVKDQIVYCCSFDAQQGDACA